MKEKKRLALPATSAEDARLVTSATSAASAAALRRSPIDVPAGAHPVTPFSDERIDLSRKLSQSRAKRQPTSAAGN